MPMASTISACLRSPSISMDFRKSPSPIIRINLKFKKVFAAGGRAIYHSSARFPRPITRNVEGIVDENAIPLLPPEKPYVDAATGGKRLNYNESTHQRPVLSFGGETSEAWDGEIRNVPQKGFQSVRRKRELQPSDQHELDLKHYRYDFS